MQPAKQERTEDLHDPERLAEVIKKRTRWHQNNMDDGSLEIVAETEFCGVDFCSVRHIAADLIRTGGDKLDFALADTLAQIRKELFEAACRELRIPQ